MMENKSKPFDKIRYNPAMERKNTWESTQLNSLNCLKKKSRRLKNKRKQKKKNQKADIAGEVNKGQIPPTCGSAATQCFSKKRCLNHWFFSFKVQKHSLYLSWKVQKSKRRCFGYMNRLRTQRQPHETDSASRFFTKNQKEKKKHSLGHTHAHTDSTRTAFRFKQLPPRHRRNHRRDFCLLIDI